MRIAQKTTEANKTEDAKKTTQKMKLVIREIVGKTAALNIARTAKSQRNEAQNGNPEVVIEEQEPEMKIPSLEEGESSATYDSDSEDSIPPVNWEF